MWNKITKVKKGVFLRRPKAVCSPSYVEYRLNSNAATLQNTGHTQERSRTGGVG
jgi:hypothetical protein